MSVQETVAPADLSDQPAETAKGGSRRERRRDKRRERRGRGGASSGGGAVYGLGLIGAVVYFFEGAVTPRDYALALPKAMFWPAFLVYRLLKSFDV